MIVTCEEFTNKYQIEFNPTKSKLKCFNASIDHTPHIILNDQPVYVVFKDKYLGNYISSSINDRHIIENTCDLYQRAICWLASLDLVIVKPLTDYTQPIVCTCMAVNCGI